MTYSYDENNIFAKILRGEIPNKTVAENRYALAFEDINPAAPIHILVIPKGPYVNYDHFLEAASAEEKWEFDNLFLDIIRQKGLRSDDGKNGYRLVTNAGPWGCQEVPHYHIHILAGQPIGPLVAR